jgi:hypothetical protein
MACYCFVLCICDRVCLLSIFWSIQGLNVWHFFIRTCAGKELKEMQCI